MLEFNEEHKEVDLTNVKKHGIINRAKVIIAGILLSAVIIFSGCGNKEQAVTPDQPQQEETVINSTNVDRAMIEIGGKYYVVDIDDFERNKDNIMNRDNLKLTLTDGTDVIGNPSDIYLYSSESKTMQEIEKNISAINTYSEETKVKNGEIDRALIQMGDNIEILEIKDYVADGGNSSFTITNHDGMIYILVLKDGTRLRVDPSNLILFMSESPIMNQIQDDILNKGKTK